MKAKFALQKGAQNKKFVRTLKLGNRTHSHTTTNSKKKFLISTIENTTIKKSPNKSKYNTIIFHPNLTNKKIKINNHIEIHSKDKNLKRCTTEQNYKTLNDNNNKSPYSKVPQINHKNNINIYRKINSFSSKKNEQSKTNKTQIISKSKNKNKKTYLNFKEKIIFRTPLRIRKNGSNGGIFGKLSSENSKINITETNNNKTLIENLKKEIEFLKKEKIYKNELIEKMKQQIKENKNKQKVINENKKLKKELKDLKSNIKVENNKMYKVIDIFDEFKNEYIEKKSKVVRLKKEKDDLISELNYKVYNNLHIKKNIEINIKGEKKNTNIKKKMNAYYDMNKYIENKYRAILKKQGENFSDYIKALRTKQINEIRFLIKMIFHSNKISKDFLLNSMINNLMNFNDIINLFIQLIKTKSQADKKIIKNYFTLICFDNKNVSNNFNINNLFNEVNYYFNDVDKIKNNFDNMNISLEKNKKIFKACKLNDKIKSGLIELDHFNTIFKAIYGNFQDNQKNKEIYNTFIVIMKNYNDLKYLDLYHLSYKNLKISKTPEKLSSLNNPTNEKKINNDEIMHNNNKDNNNNQNEINITNNNDIKNIVIKEEDDNKICNNFISELFNDALDKGNEENNIDIDNICKDFVSNVFEDCLKRKKNNKFFKICNDFVSDVFDVCLKKSKIEGNIKICNDFIEDIFDFCLKKNLVPEK